MLALSEAIRPALRAVPVDLALYDDANDRTGHLHYIEGLAQETNYPAATTGLMYEQMLAGLETGATIRDYLPTLVAKDIKSALRQIAKPH